MSEKLIIPTADPDVYLQELTPDDAPAFFNVYNLNRHDPAMRYYDLTAAQNNNSIADTAQYINRCKMSGDPFGIYHQEVLSGHIVVYLVGRSAHIGYWMDKNNRGKGITPLALNALTEWAHPLYGDIRLNIDPENKASIAVARKCGFVVEHTELVKPTFYIKRAPEAVLGFGLSD